MAKTFEIGKIGSIDDRVRLRLLFEDILIAESYTVTCSLFHQPASFEMRVGHGGVAAELIKRYPPGSSFELFVGGVPQFTGVLDDPSADDSPGGTEVTFRGRDASAPLHDDHIDSERTFKDDTYLSLVKKQLAAVGLGDRTIATSNRANRKVKGGVPIQETVPVSRTVEEILTHASGSVGVVHQQISARLNEHRYEFLNRYLQLVGLFLWAGADGNFILSEPHTQQVPTSSILRRKGMSREETNVTRAGWQNYTSHRFSRYEVYGRGAGKKNGHPKALGTYDDVEMLNWGFAKRKVVRAKNARTKDQATFLARRMCAEDRRNGSNLRYTVAGHTTPFTGGHQRAVWIPDTIHVISDELFGIEALMYLTDCTYRGSNAGTSTELVFQRPEDQVWASGEFD
jgi:prophage tail gpP-like protein